MNPDTRELAAIYSIVRTDCHSDFDVNAQRRFGIKTIHYNASLDNGDWMCRLNVATRRLVVISCLYSLIGLSGFAGLYLNMLLDSLIINVRQNLYIINITTQTEHQINTWHSK